MYSKNRFFFYIFILCNIDIRDFGNERRENKFLRVD